MTMADLILKLIEQHPFWLIWFTLIPIICSFGFKAVATQMEYVDCDSEKCCNFREDTKQV